jgi:hypothetical protein
MIISFKTHKLQSKDNRVEDLIYDVNILKSDIHRKMLIIPTYAKYCCKGLWKYENQYWMELNSYDSFNNHVMTRYIKESIVLIREQQINLILDDN